LLVWLLGKCVGGSDVGVGSGDFGVGSDTGVGIDIGVGIFDGNDVGKFNGNDVGRFEGNDVGRFDGNDDDADDDDDDDDVGVGSDTRNGLRGGRGSNVGRRGGANGLALLGIKGIVDTEFVGIVTYDVSGNEVTDGTNKELRISSCTFLDETEVTDGSFLAVDLLFATAYV